MRGWELSGMLAASLLAVLLAGCETGVTPPHFEGELSEIESPVSLQFDPVGSYTFEIRSNSEISVSIPALENLGAIQIDFEVEPVTIDLLFEGRASIAREGSVYVYDVTFNSVSLETSGNKEGDISIIWSDPALRGTFKVTGTGEPFDVEIDPASKMLEDAEGLDDLDIDISVEKSISLFGLLHGQRVVEIGQKVEMPIEEFLPDLEGSPRISGKVLWVVKGGTNLHGHPHLVGDYSGSLDIRSAEYDGTAKVGGYSLVDLSTGFESVWEKVTKVDLDVGAVTFTTVESESGRIEPSNILNNTE
jgi:hypothetical protein